MRTFVVVVVVAAVGLGFPGVAHASVSGPMTQVKFTRPADSACVTTPGKQTSAVSQTGITWDGSELLVSCWGDGWIDQLHPDGSTAGPRLEVDGLPGPGLGAIAWGGDRLWGCAITGSTATQHAQSSQLGYVQFVDGVGSWVPAGSSKRGCVNNVQVVGDQLWADGTYKGGNATSAWIDAGLPGSQLVDAFVPFTATGHVSGALPDAFGQPLWEADNFSPTKSIWQLQGGVPVRIEWGSLRFEQLTCDEASGTVYVKWHNQNRFGVIAGYGC